jgi:hypothetical protein
LSESQSFDILEIIRKYPNIAKIFSKEWFESEFNKKREDMHLLAKQFTFNDEVGVHRHHIEHLEEYLATMWDEVERNGKHFYGGLKNSERYNQTSAEIEIASLLRKMGFHQIELEPSIPNSERKADIKIHEGNTEIYIEVSTKEGPEVDYKWDFGLGIQAGPFKFHSQQTYRGKIEEEIKQLSEAHPGIIALYLDPLCIPERRNIAKSFYAGRAWTTDGKIVLLEVGESTMDYTIISAVLCYSHWFSGGCEILKELYLNPKAKNPIPDTTLSKFREWDFKIYEPTPLEQN